jgi:hypothetical protein
MSLKLLCKSCKDIFSPRQIYEVVSCKCGKCEVKALVGKGYAVKGDFSLLDDEGNELVPETMIEASRGVFDGLEPIVKDEDAMRELMLTLNHQIEAMENLSSAGQYSPVVNRDLLTVLVLFEQIVKVILKKLG